MGQDFLKLIELVRNGDEEAITQLIDEYGSTIRRAIRLHMLDGRLRRIIGESDIFQSVISRFLFDLWAGRYDFDEPAQLAALLKKMVESRVVDTARYHHAQRRDIRRNIVHIDNAGLNPAGRDHTTSQIVANREMLSEALRLFTDQEQQILDLRQEQVGWDEIAAKMGKSAEAVRKQYTRSIERVANQLQIGNAN